MSESSVRAVVGERYELDKVGEGSYLLVVKGSRPMQIEGSLGFQNGKLSVISRPWYQPDTVTPDAVDLANAFYGVVSGVNREGVTSCTLATQTRRAPRVDLKELAISCGRKTVRLVIGRQSGGSGESVVLSEQLK